LSQTHVDQPAQPQETYRYLDVYSPMMPSTAAQLHSFQTPG